MRMGEWVFRYCERGASTAVLAEPINAASNLAFLLVAYVLWRDRRSGLEGLIAAGACAVAIGSTAFHIFPTRWAELADVVPIGLLMAVLGWALLVDVAGFARRSAQTSLVGLAVAMCIAAWVMTTVGCQTPLKVTPVAGSASSALRPMGAACLNGGWTYVPVGMALWLIAALLLRRRSLATPWVAAAAAAFTLALAARSLDLTWCAPPVTLHAVWHLVAAGTIFCLARAVATARRQFAGPGP